MSIIFKKNKNPFFFLLFIIIFVCKNIYSQSNSLNVSSQSLLFVSTQSINPINIKLSTISYFSPLSERNPFLSPIDYEKIRIMEEEKKKQEEMLLNRNKEEVIKKEKLDPFKGIKVEGIVGNYVIINGVSVMKGKTYKKDYLIEQVGLNYVIINYKGKRKKFVIK
jgi:hypothetical protein